jgi:hypothetical protein
MRWRGLCVVSLFFSLLIGSHNVDARENGINNAGSEQASTNEQDKPAKYSHKQIQQVETNAV